MQRFDIWEGSVFSPKQSDHTLLDGSLRWHGTMQSGQLFQTPEAMSFALPRYQGSGSIFLAISHVQWLCRATMWAMEALQQVLQMGSVSSSASDVPGFVWSLAYATRLEEAQAGSTGRLILSHVVQGCVDA